MSTYGAPKPLISSVYDFTPEALEQVAQFLEARGLKIPAPYLLGRPKINGVTGSVSGAAAVLTGSGFSVAHPQAGVYTVTFSSVLVSVPIVVCTVNTNATFAATADLITTSGFRCEVYETDTLVLTDVAWNFIAVLPQ